MRRHKRTMPIPQHEFGFTPQAFNLILESTTDTERITSERSESETARSLAARAQAGLFCPAPTLPNPETEILNR